MCSLAIHIVYYNVMLMSDVDRTRDQRLIGQLRKSPFDGHIGSGAQTVLYRNVANFQVELAPNFQVELAAFTSYGVSFPGHTYVSNWCTSP
jgi:hypothetical protein